jgi:type I restriction enzyme R subunit
MKPEEKARLKIDRLLEAAGWEIQDYSEFNLGSSPGVAIREFPLRSGVADYMLFVNRSAAGAVEAKPEGTTLSGVSEQTQKYLTGLPAGIPHTQEPLSFSYESTGTETFFRDMRDPDSRSRRVSAFHRPEMLGEWISQRDTLRTRLKEMPSAYCVVKEGLRDCQYEAIENL